MTAPRLATAVTEVLSMLVEVAEDVRDGVSDLTRRLERLAVIALGEHPAATAPPLIQTLRDADPERAKTLAEVPRVARLADQMNVIALNREVHDAQAEPLLRELDRATDDRGERASAKVR